MQKHFVTFYSPGTLVAETTTEEIESWDIDTAISMSKDIVERYGAKPYGFRFSTRTRKDDELDSTVSANSSMYYFGVRVMTLDEIKERNDPADRILIQNMESNRLDRVVQTTSGWKCTLPLNDDDVVLGQGEGN